MESRLLGSESAYQEKLEHLVGVVQQLSLARSVEAVAAVVRGSARQLAGSDGATFILRECDQCHYADEDAIAPLWKGRRFPMTACVSGWVMINRTPAVIEDIYEDPRVPHEAYRPTFVRSMVMVPIRSADPIGAIGTYWANLHRPTDEKVKLLQALADTTAVAMENVRIYAELEQRVRDRTAGLENSIRELETFAYTVSHDLRGPLQQIGGFAELLQEDYADSLDEKGRAHVDRVCAGTHRMSQIINDLLALCRTTQASLNRTRVDLSAMAREIALELQSSDPDRTVEFAIVDGVSAVADEGLVRCALENLFSNAWKFTARKPDARIEFGVIDTPGTGSRGTRFYVRDNGTGFDSTRAVELFEPFKRLHSDREYPGTGIGLATVQRIVRKHGGQIEASSQLGQGATFYFSL